MRLLLDSHLARAVGQELRRLDVDAVALSEWQEGNYRNVPDDRLLALAHADRRVLVTCDCRTMPPLLKECAEAGQHHGGVILVNSRTFRANDAGGLLRALHDLAQRTGEERWEDRVVFLTRSQGERRAAALRELDELRSRQPERSVVEDILTEIRDEER